MSELNSRQQEAVRKAEILLEVANRALHIADETNDVDIRQVGWLQARHFARTLVELSVAHPFIQITQLNDFEGSLNSVAEKTRQLQRENIRIDMP